MHFTSGFKVQTSQFVLRAFIRTELKRAQQVQSKKKVSGSNLRRAKGIAMFALHTVSTQTCDSKLTLHMTESVNGHLLHMLAL